ncbi:flagellar hook-basal body protein FliE [Arthrobacter sp. RIT-PI-e]|uniref:flagellar hook-basal body complex protein FliE n=1 Tax=Arthrobacter sp. RIT-PI-e TaxID=1681197 RepID=UPI000675C20B|nr:flagellar hook-basal body complex protein FliE [Arthrobacter sp. RIT-PI-e]KNC20023.1 flagellar hook-basal body protein FliE [Arthrobacter sp. RIT-PI-e]
MPLSPIGVVQPAATTYLPTTGTDQVSDAGGAGFANSMTSAVDSMQSLQSASNALAVQAVTGDLSDIHNATLASPRAQVTMEPVAAVRNKGADAFNENMRMQA